MEDKITGGNTYIIATITGDQFAMTLHSEFPIKDVSFKIVDMKIWHELTEAHYAGKLPSQGDWVPNVENAREPATIFRHHWPKLGPGKILYPINIKLPNIAPGATREFRYEWDASNGFNYSHLWLHRNSDGALLTVKSFREPGGETQYKPEGVPLLENGSPDFSKM